MSNASFSVYQHTNRSLKRFTTAKFFRSLWKSSAPSKMIFDCVAQCFMSHSHVSSNHPSSTVQQDMVVRPVLSKDVMLGWRPQVLHNGDLDKSESIFHWEPSCCFCFSVRRILLFLYASSLKKAWCQANPTKQNVVNTAVYQLSSLSGYVLFCALELVMSRPPMVSALFPLMILFGLCYITFAWALYMRLGPENASSAMIHTLDREFQRDHWLLITFPPMT